MTSKYSLQKRCLPVLLLALGLLLSACAGGTSAFARPTVELIPTGTPTITLTPTATIEWFPATSTPTPQPTHPPEPTPDTLPPLGDLLVRDSFGNTELWPTFRNATGSVGYGNNELTLAIPKTKGLVSTLRKNTVLGNYYAEVGVAPSLCRGDNAFGLLVRAASEWNTYRFAVTCDGLMRIERVNNGSLLALTDWAPSEQLMPGIPDEIRLGVLAVNSELRFYINDVQQLAVFDPSFSSGGLGLFARSSGESPLTVNYHNLVVNAVSPGDIQPTPTVTVFVRPSATKAPTFTPTAKR